MSRVVVGLSGGVDSSVAAFLLKEAGHEVIGMFMRNWHDADVTISDECPWIDDSNDAMLVAEKLNIPFQVIDLSREYKNRIVDYMFDEYEHGRTPNPDVLCNREIKFDVFLKAARSLGADFVATGHYCRKERSDEGFERLLSGFDTNKDQSYFLCQVSQEQLAKALFPIGHLKKSEVREIARREGLVTADKKDSQGLCFIGKVRLPEFLQQQLKAKTGKVIKIDEHSPVWAADHTELAIGSKTEDSTLLEWASKPELVPELGEEIGEHQGAYYYTIGQRRGLNVGGQEEPLYIIGTDTHRNIVYTGRGANHPGLYRKGLFIRKKDIHWIRTDMELQEGRKQSYLLRIRYRQPLEKATLHSRTEGIYIVFDRPLRGVTPGQFAAWYKDDELIGSGVID